MLTSSETPELDFLERLRKSPLFDKDPQKTAIISFVDSDTVRNMGTFRMRVRLAKEITIPR